ncbi:MAG: hypothetical protein KGL39_19550 [Patescibacteria group bacterium]|nr:hypothetical protein [Patescibacteria group bacterium]
MPKVQLNFQVPPRLAARVRADARRNYKTLDTVGEAILEDFFRSWTKTERARFYESGAKPKISGRKIGK